MSDHVVMVVNVWRLSIIVDLLVVVQILFVKLFCRVIFIKERMI